MACFHWNIFKFSITRMFGYQYDKATQAHTCVGQERSRERWDLLWSLIMRINSIVVHKKITVLHLDTSWAVFVIFFACSPCWISFNILWNTSQKWLTSCNKWFIVWQSSERRHIISVQILQPNLICYNKITLLIRFWCSWWTDINNYDYRGAFAM